MITETDPDATAIQRLIPNPMAAAKVAIAVAAFVCILLLPMPEGLTSPGRRALAVMVLTVVLWATEAVPVPISGIIGVVLLVLEVWPESHLPGFALRKTDVFQSDMT